MQRFYRVLCGLILLSLIAIYPFTSQAAVTLSNPTTQLVVNGGEANNGLVPSNGYFRYTDIGQSEETTWSIDPVLVFSDSSTVVLSNGSAGGFGSPTDMGGGIVRSLATVNKPGLTIGVQADTQLIGTNARTTFTFTSDQPLDGTTFLFYAENDLFGAGDDEAAFTGSIAGNDLALYQYDSAAQGMTVRMSGVAGTNSTLTLFGAGLWTAWGTALEAGNLSVLSSNGSNFATVGDLGLALAFSLSGTTAVVTVDYDTQPEPPAQPSQPSEIVPTMTEWGMIMLAVFMGMSSIYFLKRQRAI